MTPARWAALALVGVLISPGSGTAQERTDSARLRVLERLERLGRAPGADSALYVLDSIRMDSLRVNRRPGAGAGSDSTLAALLALPGYAVTEYDGGHARFGAAQRELTLQAAEGGRARVNRDGIEVQADSSILYNEETGRVRTIGESTFTPPEGDPVESGGLIYDLQSGRGSAVGARTSYNQGSARWNVTGDMPYANQDSTFMAHARFTSCDLEEPHYHFETDEIKIVGGRLLVARPVRLYFADVPVAWLPFIAQSISQGRSSGLLTPRFSVNDIVRTSGGYNRRISNVGFYWAMSDYSDAIVAFDWFSENFFSMTASTAYRWNRQFLDGDVNFRRYWRNEGSTELALNTRHSWEMDERTQLRMSGSYISNSDFLEANSTNPLEVIQSIDSEGGINRRFDWGSLSLQANRKQYLSDDRVEMTLPSLNLSLSTVTLFQAPSNRASFYNNMTWSGSGSFRRQTTDRLQPEVFDPTAIDRANTSGSLSSNISLGRLTFSQGIDIREESEFDIPEAYLLQGDSASESELVMGAPARSVNRTDLGWRTSLNYQQQLFGSTTLTPRLSMTGSQIKSDTSALAQSFVSAPTRLSFGATLKTDIYGFLRGGIPERLGFEAIRHKFSPSFEYTWSPEVQPDSLQRKVFGSRVLQPQNALSVTLNQTWEAKRVQPEDTTGAASDTAATVSADGEPRRVERAPVVNLLALRTSVVRYDFVEADSAGQFLAGFETTRLTNQVSSDFLRGLTLSVEHELFDEGRLDGAGTDGTRTFAPHLASLNMSFSLNDRSGIFRLLGLAGGGSDDEPEEDPEDEDDPFADPDADFDPDDPFAAAGATDESSMVPGSGARRQNQQQRGQRGGWNASLSYALTRPRDPALESSKMLNGTITLRPTEHWDLSWRTSYDIERSRFNDHSVRLSRDLHRWKANFDFLQTATGNWTFRFEVSLIDNQDLKFDYEQRNLDVGLPPSRR